MVRAPFVALMPAALFLLALYFDEISAFFQANQEETASTAPSATENGLLSGRPAPALRGVQVKAAPATAPVFLDDFTPLKAHVGYGRLGTHGKMGFEGLRVVVGGKRFSHALGMHPEYGGSASYATFALSGDKVPPAAARMLDAARAGGGRAVLKAHYGIADSATPHKRDVIFTVRGKGAGGAKLTPWAGPGRAKPPRPDGARRGTVLWRSAAVVEKGHLQALAPPIDVTNLAEMSLEVQTPGSNACAHAAWVEPRIESAP
eukprot:g1378.t1